MDRDQTDGSPSGRRTFLRWLAKEGVALVEEARGRPQLQLGDLAGLPDEKLALIVPVIAPGIGIDVTEYQVTAARGEQDARIVLFDCAPETVFIFNQFDGTTSIAQAATELSTAMSLSAEESFTLTRDLFLHLARLGVCVPANPVY